MTGRPTIAALAVACLLVTACEGGLRFTADTRVHIVSPAPLSTVTLPVHLRWTGALPPGRGLGYAVFVDALPVHPGQDLRALAGRSCAGVPGCVDVAWLNRHSVYPTAEPRLDLDVLPILGTPKGQPDMHTATVVLVDREWRRVAESAWTVTFAVRKPPAP